MNSYLCRLCGKSGQDFIDIFSVKRLVHQIETCLPIRVSKHSPLPDKACPQCIDSISQFYDFTKICLQNITTLENKLDIEESCILTEKRINLSPNDHRHYLNPLSRKNDFSLPSKLSSGKTDKTLAKHEEDSESDSDEGIESGQTIYEAEKPESFLNYVENRVSQITNKKRKRESSDDTRPKRLQKNANRVSIDNAEKPKRSLPSLVKISDLKRSNSFEQTAHKITCPNCRMVFFSKPELFVHLQLNHSDLATFICGICLDPLQSDSALRLHVAECAKKHPIGSRYFCIVCYFGDNNYLAMENHVLVHNFLWQNCQKQKTNFNPEDYIGENRNFVPNSPIKHFACSECDQSSFDTFHKFSTHRRTVHSIFHCDLCSKHYGKSSHLWKHVNRLHKKHPSITCQVCDKMSASKYYLAQHFTRLHQKVETVTKKPIEQCQAKITVQQEETNAEASISTTRLENDDVTPTKGTKSSLREYKCPQCSKIFHKLMLLRKHRSICRPKHQRELLTRCATCKRVFKDRHSLSKHVVNHHSTYKCQICNEEVTSKYDIINHIRFQHPFSDLICPICNSILRCKKDLLEHLADHDNSFVCQYCGDTLATEVKIKMHILSLHRQIIGLSCGICLQLFDSQYSLRNHVISIHREQLVPLMSCSVCGKNYGSKWKAFDHINKSHGKFFKACKICLEICETDSGLEKHIEQSHVNAKRFLRTVKGNPVVLRTSAKKNKKEIEKNIASEVGGKELNKPEPVNHNLKLSNQDQKICLLEKRILGKAPSGKLVHQIEEEKSASDKTKENQIGSSKRTVYDNNDIPSSCEVCHKTWPAKKHLWQHYIRCHKAVAATVCGICLKTNVTYTDLQIHLQNSHPTLMHGQGHGSKLICQICGRYHNARSKLRLHMAVHENFDMALLKKHSEDENVIKPAHKGNKELALYENMIEQVEESTCSTTETEIEHNNSDLSSDSSSPSQREGTDEKMLFFENLVKRLHQSKEITQANNGQDLRSQENVPAFNNYNHFNYGVKEESGPKHEDANVVRDYSAELDPAIISLDNSQLQIKPESDDFNNVSLHQNDSEIERAVGSIL